jgi:hypothetical protein
MSVGFLRTADLLYGSYISFLPLLLLIHVQKSVPSGIKYNDKKWMKKLHLGRARALNP